MSNLPLKDQALIDTKEFDVGVKAQAPGSVWKRLSYSILKAFLHDDLNSELVKPIGFNCQYNGAKVDIVPNPMETFIGNKGLVSGQCSMFGGWPRETIITVPIANAPVFVYYNGLYQKYFPLYIKRNVQALWRDIENRRIQFEFTDPGTDNFSLTQPACMLVNFSGEISTTSSVDNTFDEEVNLSYLEGESNYYAASGLSGKNILISAVGEYCELQLPVGLVLDEGETAKSIVFQIPEDSFAILLKKFTTETVFEPVVECLPGTIINAFYSASTDAWNTAIIAPEVILPEIANFSDVTVLSSTNLEVDVIINYMRSNGVIFAAEYTSTATQYGGADGMGYFFIKDQLSNEENGIYENWQTNDLGDGTFQHLLTKVANIEDLNIVRVQQGTEKGVWYSQNLNDNGSFQFKLIATASKPSYSSEHLTIAAGTPTIELKFATRTIIDNVVDDTFTIEIDPWYTEGLVPDCVNESILIFTTGDTIPYFSAFGAAVWRIEELELNPNKTYTISYEHVDDVTANEFGHVFITGAENV